ncbi:hypothetical protein ACWG8W_01220 [Citricoccus zhacaiensis]
MRQPYLFIVVFAGSFATMVLVCWLLSPVLELDPVIFLVPSIAVATILAFLFTVRRAPRKER